MTLRAGPVIAIDGPVGAGKTTIARALAHSLGFRHINTGAMYRAVAIAARARYTTAELSGPATERRLAELLNSISIKFDRERVLLDGRDISDAIPTPAISDLASRLSALGVVRARMRELQRAAGETGRAVIEGRDIGTVVFPDAEFKFFLTAAVAVRATRRYAELCAHGVAVSEAEVLAQLRERDQRDEGRELAPLRPATDSILIDASVLTVEEVVQQMKAHIQSKSTPL